ncbi:MAG: hypothetical protein QOE79_1288 [Sphingomonadales bacterium]|jgi:hypothetical protein|nr:hypothetical protein [Sphingomonadales bacterium]MEA3050047.1 hypothetical protein [Sphingomonadales bacterium]
MNIHLLMRCALPAGDGGLSDVPLILDPDTGNMGSQP